MSQVVFVASTELTQFSNMRLLYSSDRYLIFRAQRKIDDKSVILKMLRSDNPKLAHLEALKHEYSLLKYLNSVKGVNKVFEILTEPTLILVQEDSGALSLKEFLDNKGIPVSRFFPIALQITEILGEIHAQHVIHKDLNPSNIIIKPETGEIKIIDFSLASQLDEEIQEEINPHLLEGTLKYIAPERTGRMNRPTDYRSDFYSLGVTFYEMLTNSLPFKSQDPLELIHDHIAKLPPPIANVPLMLAKLIAKLMAKNPDDRYASALGIKADLVKCLEEKEFTLGSNDVLDRFHISHKLYGRKEEIQKILDTYHKVSNGSSELLLISGYSGIGKTSLVREVHKPMSQERGFFISGKFDQMQRSVPFVGFVQSFQGLIHQILSEPEDKLALTRKEILEALEINGQIMIDIIPELELLIGKQPPVPTLPLQQAQNRFFLTFQNFVNVFAKPMRPLVIFLDDLQWIDSGSLKLLEVLLTDKRMQYLLILGAYRDNEVSPHHPFMMTLEDLKKGNVSAHNIILQPLLQQDLTQLIDDSFPSKTFETEGLTSVVYEKTRGNPFFINEFLKLLNREHILKFNYSRLAWDVDLPKIQSLGITDNVVDLMIKNIQKLSLNSQSLLKLAACIGFSFDLKTLSVVSEKNPRAVQIELWEALKAGLITGDNYENIALDEADVIDKISYKFLHDRIQQAAYSLIPIETRQQKQLVIGRLLLKDWKQHASSDLSSVINHFGESLDLITDVSEKKELAAFYQKVGHAAKASTAYQAALNYYSSGSRLLEPADWDKDYEILFDLRQEMADCEYLTGQFEQAELHFKQLLNLSKDKYDKAKVTHAMMAMYTTSAKLDLAVKVALENLKLFHVTLHEKPSKFSLIVELLKVKWLLRKKNIEELDKMPPMQDKDKLYVIKTLVDLTDSVYIYDQDLWAYNLLRMLRYFLTYGNFPNSAVVIGFVSGFFSAINDYETFIKLVALKEKLEVNLETKHKILLGFGAFSIHFRLPISKSIECLDEGYKASLDSGDLNYASYSIFIKSAYLFYSGKPLEGVLKEFSRCKDFCASVKRFEWETTSQIFIQNILSFLNGDSQKNAKDVESILALHSKERTLDAFNMGIALELAFYLNEPLQTLESGRSFYNNQKQYLTLLFFLSNFYLYYAISILDCLRLNPSAVIKEDKKSLKAISKQIDYWALHCPENFAFQSLLLKAEQARVKGKEQEALRLYDQAIEAAQKNGFVQYVAIINERAADYYLQLNKPKVAKSYLLEAYNYYQRWGAKGLAKKLEQKYPQWLTENPLYGGDTSTSSRVENLDLLSISKATQAISEEMVLDRLLTRIVQIVLENAAAERVVILQGQPLRIIAEGTLEKINVHEAAEPTAESLPLSIPAYVLRTKQAVVLHDATNQPEQFKQDPYLSKNQIKSVLCAPISYQSKIMGILYLENNLVTHAFTQDRLKVLSVLSSQAAISLENSRHFERMNQLYHSTERFVPKPFLELLHKENIEDIALGDGVEQDVTVLFSDLRNFTTLMQNQTSQDAFKIVNRYLKFVAPVIRKYRGFINQFLGDGILALFPHAAHDAFDAGIAILSALKEFNRQQRELGGLELEMGIGINTGPAMFGIIGEEERLDPAVISDVTNTAARVESLNKLYGTHLLITDHTFKALGSENYPLRRIDKVFLKGRDIPTQLYELIDWEEKLVDISLKEYLALFYDAFAQYEKGDFAAAKSQFANCLKYLPADRVSEIFIERCEHFSKEGTPKNWNGTFILTHK